MKSIRTVIDVVRNGERLQDGGLPFEMHVVRVGGPRGPPLQLALHQLLQLGIRKGQQQNDLCNASEKLVAPEVVLLTSDVQ